MPDGKLTLNNLFDTLSNIEIEILQDFSATLLQIPGQKYSIGSSYERRRENEEFIFFGYSFEKGHDFQIKVDENGSFWIQRESDEYQLSVNVIPVRGREAYKLTFGDRIEISFTNTPVTTKKEKGFRQSFGRIFKPEPSKKKLKILAVTCCSGVPHYICRPMIKERYGHMKTTTTC